MINQLFLDLLCAIEIHPFLFQVSISGLSNPFYSGYVFRVVYGAVQEEFVLLLQQSNPELCNRFNYVFHFLCSSDNAGLSRREAAGFVPLVLP